MVNLVAGYLHVISVATRYMATAYCIMSGALWEGPFAPSVLASAPTEGICKSSVCRASVAVLVFGDAYLHSCSVVLTREVTAEENGIPRGTARSTLP